MAGTAISTAAGVTPRGELKAARGPKAERDLRLDFFRGLALMFIFIDHVPGNFLGDFTMKNFGFVDAAEVFVLIAGYAAALAYGGAFARHGFAGGTRRVGRRIGQLYVAHIVLLIVCVGGITIAARLFENPLYFEHVNVIPFYHAPFEAIWRALALTHQLGYLNILPLYIVLLAWFPALFWLMRQHRGLALAASLALYALPHAIGANLPSFPDGNGWFFNPFAWQLLFSIGVLLGDMAARGIRLPRSRVLFGLAAAYLLFALIVIAPWTMLPGLDEFRLVPGDLVAPVDKSTLSPWRLAHILALAYVVACLVKPQAGWFRQAWARAVILCGRKSLDIFCLGTVLSFAGMFVLVEAGRGLAIQLAVNAIGLAAMVGMAWVLARRASTATRRTLSPVLDPAEARSVSARP